MVRRRLTLGVVALGVVVAAGCHRRQPQLPSPPPPKRRVVEYRPPTEDQKYRQKVIDTVRGNFQPGAYQRTRLSTKVFFEVDPDGSLRGTEITTGSGNVDFDLLALRAIADTGWVDPPPPQLSNQFRKFVVQFQAD